MKIFRKLFVLGNRLVEERALKKVLLLAKMVILNRVTKYPPEVCAFEDKFRNFVNVDYCQTFSSGTTAFEASLFAIGLKDGDEVLIPSSSFATIVLSILNMRLKPVFLDIDKNLSPIFLDELVSNKTRALVITHLFGNPLDMNVVMRFASRHNLAVIEDCSHAHGALFGKKHVGGFGDIGVFSLQGFKAVSGGEAGIAVTNQKLLIEKMQLYSHIGFDFTFLDANDPRRATALGRKARMHPFAAALASVDLDTLPVRNKTLISKIDTLASLVNQMDHMSMIDSPSEATHGGFHHGIPLWVNDEDVKASLVSKSPTVFRDYPYVDYHHFSELRSPEKYLSYLSMSGEEVVKRDFGLQLPGTEDVRKHMLFMDLAFLKSASSGQIKNAITL